MKKLCGVTYVMRCKLPAGHPGRCKFVGPHRFQDAEADARIQRVSRKKPVRSKN